MAVQQAFLPIQPVSLRKQNLPIRRTRRVTAVLDSPRPKVATPPTLPRPTWTPSSWRDRKALQQPTYPDRDALERVEKKLERMPPLVGVEELRSLRAQLADACFGKAFVLQGGDCAEDLNESAEGIACTLRALFRMAVVLMWGAQSPVVKIGRLGGQYAKPRSSDFETIDGVSLPSYRGEIINGSKFDETNRIPDPERMMLAYMRSASTTNYSRSLAGGGYANLKKVRSWGMDWCRSTEKGREYLLTAERIAEAVDFMNICGIEADPNIQSTSVYTSHEGLLLPYEEALVRRDEETGEYYAGSGHFIWVGERTRGVEDSHIEFVRGISNPVAVKVGSSMKPDELLRICDLLNPLNEPGRLTLITRMGADKIVECLPHLVRAIKREGRHVVWISDSMHGNTYKSESGYKTRNFDEIMREVRGFFAVHEAEGSVAGGLHFEMTGKKVTECVGGLNELTSEDLHSRYESLCDPRLNLDQSLQMAFEVAGILAHNRSNR